MVESQAGLNVLMHKNKKCLGRGDRRVGLGSARKKDQYYVVNAVGKLLNVLCWIHKCSDSQKERVFANNCKF